MQSVFKLFKVEVVKLETKKTCDYLKLITLLLK